MGNYKHTARFAGVKGNAVLLAHNFVAEALYNGCLAVDATAGNGNDTLFLAERAGPGGRVYAFDIQPCALDITGSRLKKAGLQDRVVLIQAGHESMQMYLEEPVDAFLFNLGYLPGGDHAVYTRPDTTATALNNAIQLLKPGGRIAMVVYTGHSGAVEESRVVQSFVSGLDPRFFGVLKVQFANRPEHTPYLILIERAVAKNENLAQQKNR